ncbi:MAG: gadC [Gammaproteobacteria bacterium]|jgi:amino acid transporter|nr:gadC [Gammaproteobacteria bacterium]
MRVAASGIYPGISTCYIPRLELAGSKGQTMAIMQTKHPRKKTLSLFSLVMINVIAVDSLRNLPLSAEYGLSLLFFYAVGALCFFIPICLVTAELATGWPTTGGLYIWVREAFGRRWGLLAIWLQWVYNIVWYPTILAFLSSTLAYLVNPNLAENRIYTLSTVMIIFWVTTFINCFGMRASAWLSTAGALFGTLLPMLLITVLGIVWLFNGHVSAISFSPIALLPDLHAFNNIAFFIAILFGLVGIEMSAVHAGDVTHPERDYPRALLISAVVILFTLVGASLAIAIVLPQEKISLVAGLIQAYSVFFESFHLTWMIPVMVILIVVGGMSGVGAWLMGPARGLMVAGNDGYLPSLFVKCNRFGAPQRVLITQGLVFSVLCSVFLLMPTVNSSYWVLSALTAQLALIVYILFFVTALKLRHKHAHVKRAYQIPGGPWGIGIVCGMGLITCFFAIVIGFIPPEHIFINNLVSYDAILVTGLLLFCGVPWLFRDKKA